MECVDRDVKCLDVRVGREVAAEDGVVETGVHVDEAEVFEVFVATAPALTSTSASGKTRSR